MLLLTPLWSYMYNIWCVLGGSFVVCGGRRGGGDGECLGKCVLMVICY